MKAAAIIGYTGKGLFNTPRKIDNVTDLHTNFGKKSNATSVAEQLLFADYKPVVVRLEEDAALATANLLDENGTVCMTITADSPGMTGASTTVEVTREGNRFSLLIFNNGEMVEFWGNLTSTDAEEVINFGSKWIVVKVQSDSLPKKSINELHIENRKYPRINLDVIIKALKSIEDWDIEFISIPDCDSPGTINGVLQYLEDNCPETMLVIDPPFEFDLIQTHKWCKSIITSEQGVLFWPWLKYERRSIPPSGPVIAAMLSWPFVWKPVRTKLNGVSEPTFSVHHDELAYLSRQEHFINLATKKLDSLVLESKILTLAGSKLSERRLLNHLKGQVSRIGKSLLSAHDPISNNFRNNFIECCEYILRPIKDDQGINSYLVQINEFSKPDELVVNLELSIRDSVEIVNMCFKFTK